MPRNLELKARCSSLASASVTARSLCGRKKAILRQTDTYFGLPEGRLKLREIAGRKSELIWYHRPDKAGVRLSRYVIVPVANPNQICSLFGKLFGTLVRVQKERHLYLFRNARIHLDRVKGLGEFIEFEVVIRKGLSQAKDLMSFLRSEFRIRRNELRSSSYSNLLLNRSSRTRS